MKIYAGSRCCFVPLCRLLFLVELWFPYISRGQHHEAKRRCPESCSCTSEAFSVSAAPISASHPILPRRYNMLRIAIAKVAPVAVRPAARTILPRAGAARYLAASTSASKPPSATSGDKPKEPWEEEGVVLAQVEDSLEWTLSSPPPIHQFDEPPIIVEIDQV